LVKWHLNKLDLVKFKVRVQQTRYLQFLDDLLMGEQNPDEPKPKTNFRRRALFFRRHKLNILDNVYSKLGFKRQVLKYHLPSID